MAQKSTASSRHAPQSDTKSDDMTEPKWVTYKLDILNPPPLTEEQKEELRKLDNALRAYVVAQEKKAARKVG